MAGVELGRCCDVPIEKESRDPEVDSTIRRSPGTLWGGRFPPLGMHLGEVALPLKGLKS